MKLEFFRFVRFVVSEVLALIIYIIKFCFVMYDVTVYKDRKREKKLWCL